MASLFISTFQITFFWSLRDQIISVCTSDAEIAAAISQAWPVLLIFTLFDATQITSAAFIKATGKQCNGAIFTSSGYWLFGIPIAYYFGLHLQLGVLGLWIGPVVACAYLTLMYNVLISCFRWDKLYDEIEERRRTENEERSRLLQETLMQARGNQDDFTRVQDDDNDG
mmetsp:Transcript_7652/g.9210  ORF Transcript_7652/g.9210 Transcript_7652/m.9210 type:complete len:169 (-) Transcript_7652:100-606(-)